MASQLAPLIPTPPVTIKGRFFWQGDRRFIINGVVFQPHPPGNKKAPLIDPLAEDQLYDLERSIPSLKVLGINTIFVLYINCNNNHDVAMDMLAEAGIYVLPCIAPPYDESADLSELNPYRLEVLQWYFKAVDNMTKYPNTLGLVLSCEFINDVYRTVLAPMLRAVVRDVKKYIRLIARKKNVRALPVGIFAPDEPSLLKPHYEYFVSGPEKEAIDFLGFNEFSRPRESPLHESSYDDIIEIFASSPVPVFFSMYGNNTVSPRLFHETNCLYCDFNMLSIFSGGFVYEFFQKPGTQFGLIARTENPRGYIGYTELIDFRNLRDVLTGSFMRLPPLTADFPPSAIMGIKPQPPEPSENWLASQNIPHTRVQWFNVEEAIDDSEWIDLGQDVLEDAVDDLEFAFKERFNISDGS
ncbi:glycoside hydrolase family 72 protein [Annulohypoxylon maeteangense]|uniref:glycoside hydrolase family 72 protein n=1 Tax=Annulohypoxylon maeteangense TaxID=1927788 RepID=UPI0020081D6B|nr:glycoside hydrolase family 72 protein [Annulohypoxylon maeteangense]KAI0884929.1 glycoside hydrolase family 72 protein [Annulohypoxylon maeteangense]